MTRKRLLDQQEKRETNTQRAREAGPPRREESCPPEEGKQRVLQALRRQECIGAASVDSDAGVIRVTTRF